MAFALAAALAFGLALVLTQHGAGDVDGRVRTCVSMAAAAVVALAVVGTRGGFHWPGSATGWWGLALLTLLYGTGITVLLTVLPRLGVVGNTAIMNVEPVFALVLAWFILGQRVASVPLAELVKAGYSWTSIGPCAGTLRRESEERPVTCAAPRIEGRAEERLVRAPEVNGPL